MPAKVSPQIGIQSAGTAAFPNKQNTIPNHNIDNFWNNEFFSFWI